MRAISRALVLMAVLSMAVLSVAPSVARAQQPSDDYQTLISNGLSEFGVGNFAEARALFRRAHELQPSARTLRGIGMTSFELREYADAVRALGASLADARRPLESPQREQVEALLARAQAFVGRYRLALDPSDARVLVDARPAVVEADGTLLIELGRHTVLGRADGRRDATLTIDVRGGEQDTLPLRLEPAAARTAVADPQAALSTPTPALPQTDRAGSIAPIVWLTAAGALAVSSVVSGVAWWKERAAELSQCDDAGDRCRNRSAVETERAAAAVVTIALGTAAVGALVLGVLSLSADGDSAEHVAIRCLPGLANVQCVGEF